MSVHWRRTTGVVIFFSVVLVAFAIAWAAGPPNGDAEAAEAAACKGTYKIQKSHYQTTPNIATGEVRYCTENGKITKVFNEEVKAIDSSHSVLSDANLAVFVQCEELQGNTYKTMKGKRHEARPYYVCLKDGEIIRLLD